MKLYEVKALAHETQSRIRQDLSFLLLLSSIRAMPRLPFLIQQPILEFHMFIVAHATASGRCAYMRI